MVKHCMRYFDKAIEFLRSLDKRVRAEKPEEAGLSLSTEVPSSTSEIPHRAASQIDSLKSLMTCRYDSAMNVLKILSRFNTTAEPVGISDITEALIQMGVKEEELFGNDEELCYVKQFLGGDVKELIELIPTPLSLMPHTAQLFADTYPEYIPIVVSKLVPKVLDEVHNYHHALIRTVFKGEHDDEGVRVHIAMHKEAREVLYSIYWLTYMLAYSKDARRVFDETFKALDDRHKHKKYRMLMSVIGELALHDVALLIPNLPDSYWVACLVKPTTWGADPPVAVSRNTWKSGMGLYPCPIVGIDPQFYENLYNIATRGIWQMVEDKLPLLERKVKSRISGWTYKLLRYELTRHIGGKALSEAVKEPALEVFMSNNYWVITQMLASHADDKDFIRARDRLHKLLTWALFNSGKARSWSPTVIGIIGILAAITAPDIEAADRVLINIINGIGAEHWVYEGIIGDKATIPPGFFERPFHLHTREVVAFLARALLLMLSRWKRSDVGKTDTFKCLMAYIRRGFSTAAEEELRVPSVVDSRDSINSSLTYTIWALCDLMVREGLQGKDISRVLGSKTSHDNILGDIWREHRRGFMEVNLAKVINIALAMGATWDNMALLSEEVKAELQRDGIWDDEIKHQVLGIYATRDYNKAAYADLVNMAHSVLAHTVRGAIIEGEGLPRDSEGNRFSMPIDGIFEFDGITDALSYHFPVTGGIIITGGRGSWHGGINYPFVIPQLPPPNWDTSKRAKWAEAYDRAYSQAMKYVDTHLSQILRWNLNQEQVASRLKPYVKNLPPGETLETLTQLVIDKVVETVLYYVKMGIASRYVSIISQLLPVSIDNRTLHLAHTFSTAIFPWRTEAGTPIEGNRLKDWLGMAYWPKPALEAARKALDIVKQRGSSQV